MKNHALKLVAFHVVLLGNTGSLFADSYGMAGCGIASLVFMDKPGKIQLLAATTNNLPVQAFTMTWGTSGCSEDNKSASLNFIRTNEFALREDISKGRGETLSALFRFWGCRQTDGLSKKLQSRYAEIFPEPHTPSESIRDTMESTLKPDCSALVG